MRLSTAIGLYALATCTLIFAGVTFVLESGASKGVKEQAHRVTRLLQTEMVRCIDGEIAHVEANVNRTAFAFEEMGRLRNEQNLTTTLRLMIAADSMIIGGSFAYVPGHAPDGQEKWMVYANRTDSTILSRQLASTDYNYPEMEWFVLPVQTGRPVWSRPYFDRGAGDCLMTTYSQPVTDADGRVTGVVTADVELSTLIKALQRLKPYDASLSFLIDSEGKLVGDAAMYGKIEAFQQKILDNIELHVEKEIFRDHTFSIDGRSYLSNYSGLQGLGLVVCTVTPYNTVVSTFREMRIPFFLVITLGLLLLLAGIYAVIRYSSQPLARLTASAVKIGEGDFNVPLPPAGSFTDLRKLRDAMEFMESSICRYIADIETVTRKSERIQSELDIAARIQRSMLPGKWEETDGVRISALLESAREVSGDMYDYVQNGDAVYVLVADVSGKGVPASLVMTAVLSLFRAEAGRGAPPSEILAGINRVIGKGNTNCMFVTALLLKLQQERLVLSNAGHNPPLIWQEGQWSSISLYPALPLGIMEETCYHDTTVGFKPQSRLLLYTDGLTEAENSSGELFGEDRLKAFLSSETDMDPEHIVADLRRSVAHFATETLADDMTIVCLGKEAGREVIT